MGKGWAVSTGSDGFPPLSSRGKTLSGNDETKGKKGMGPRPPSSRGQDLDVRTTGRELRLRKGDCVSSDVVDSKIPRLRCAALGITMALLWPRKGMKMDMGFTPIPRLHEGRL